MQQETGAFTRLMIQTIIAILQIFLVSQIFQFVNLYLQFSLFPTYELYLTFPTLEEQAAQLWLIIETLNLLNGAILIFGIAHAIWRILDNLISWLGTRKATPR
jgi:uncharacterized membrane protein